MTYQEAQEKQEPQKYCHGKNCIVFREHFPDSGKTFSDCIVEMIERKMSQKNHKSFVAQTIASQIEEEIPTPLYIEQSLIVGEEYFLEDLFELEFSNGSLIPFGADSDIALYLIDIKNANHTSILTTLSTENITSLNTIPSSAIYNTDKKLLYFYSS